MLWTTQIQYEILKKLDKVDNKRIKYAEDKNYVYITHDGYSAFAIPHELFFLNKGLFQEFEKLQNMWCNANRELRLKCKRIVSFAKKDTVFVIFEDIKSGRLRYVNEKLLKPILKIDSLIYYCAEDKENSGIAVFDKGFPVGYFIPTKLKDEEK